MNDIGAAPTLARAGGLAQRPSEPRNTDVAFTKLIQERITRVGQELEIIPQVDRPMTAADVLALFDGIAAYARRGRNKEGL